MRFSFQGLIVVAVLSFPLTSFALPWNDDPPRYPGEDEIPFTPPEPTYQIPLTPLELPCADSDSSDYNALLSWLETGSWGESSRDASLLVGGSVKFEAKGGTKTVTDFCDGNILNEMACSGRFAKNVPVDCGDVFESGTCDTDRCVPIPAVDPIKCPDPAGQILTPIEITRDDEDGNGIYDSCEFPQLIDVNDQGVQIEANTFMQPYPDISHNGRYVTFSSSARGLVAGDTDDKVDVFVRDRLIRATERVSVSSQGTAGNNYSFKSRMSSDGNWVVFGSDASNFTTGDVNASDDVFLRDRSNSLTTLLAPLTYGKDISGDAAFVAFASDDMDLLPGTVNTWSDVFVLERATGALSRVSVSSDGIEANHRSLDPRLNADGRIVVFYSEANNLVPDDTNLITDLFVHDVATGTTERVNVASDGSQANGPTQAETAVSDDGTRIAFFSEATNLVSGDTNHSSDVFVRDLAAGTTSLVSVSDLGVQANSHSYNVAISGDGRFVAFNSEADNLVEGDDNRSLDVFVHDTLTARTVRVSLNRDGQEIVGNTPLGPVFGPTNRALALSGDGRFVVFSSHSRGFAPGDASGYPDPDVFLTLNPLWGTERNSL